MIGTLIKSTVSMTEPLLSSTLLCMPGFMTRRRLLAGLIALSGAGVGYALAGRRTNIKDVGGKTLDYLLDPDLRRKETGDALMTIEDVEFSGVTFRDLEWRNLRFKNCRFASGYEILLTSLENAVFEDCEFAGILQFGKLKNVRHLRCTANGHFNWIGDEGSDNVTFEDCVFTSDRNDPNSRGAVGTYGQASFIKCKFTYSKIIGYRTLSLSRCNADTTDIPVSDMAGGADVSIEDCVFTGQFDVRPALLRSFSMRKVTVDNLDMTNATVKGAILLEDVVAKGPVKMYLEAAESLTIRRSRFAGNGHRVFQTYAGNIKRVEVDTVVFGRVSGEYAIGIILGGGIGEDFNHPDPQVTDSLTIRNCEIPQLLADHLYANKLVLENNRIGNAELHTSRLGELVIRNTTVSESLDFSLTQAKTQRIEGLIGAAVKHAKLDGSNVRLP